MLNAAQIHASDRPVVHEVMHTRLIRRGRGIDPLRPLSLGIREPLEQLVEVLHQARPFRLGVTPGRHPRIAMLRHGATVSAAGYRPMNEDEDFRPHIHRTEALIIDAARGAR